MSEQEGIYTPDPFEAVNIKLPLDLRTQTHQETHKLLITLWLESFVSAPSEEFKKLFIDIFSNYGTQEFKDRGMLDSDLIHEILQETVVNLKQKYPQEYQRLASHMEQSYIVFNGVSINFHEYFDNNELKNTENKVNIEIAENIFGTDVENILGIEIHGRDDVNTVEVLKTLDLKIGTSGGRFTQADAEKILQDAFTLAFEREMKGVMKKQTQYMRVNYDVWQEAFSQRLTEISNPDLQTLLLFLPFVESNLDPKAKSDSGAIGLWQLTPATAKRNGGGFTITPEDLQDPLVSTKVAARYLDRIIGNLKRDFPNQSEEEIVMMALREYNGAWSARLKPEYRIDTFKTVLQIYLQLDIIEAVFEDSRMNDEEKLKEMVEYIGDIETTFFDGHGLSEYVVMQGYNASAKLLYSWSQDYLKKIVLQQLMYPYQVVGASRAYQNIQNTL